MHSKHIIFINHQTAKYLHETEKTVNPVCYIYKVNKLLSLLLSILAFTWSGFSQSPSPAGFANGSTLDEKLGYDGFNYATIYHAPSGKVYTCTYDGNLAIHGNNYSIALPSLSALPANGGKFHEVNENETWYYDSKKIIILRNDTLNRVLLLPAETHMYTITSQGLLVIHNAGGSAEVYLFNGDSLYLTLKAPAVPVNASSGLFRNESGDLYYAISFKDSLRIYRVITAPVSISLIKTYPTGAVYIYNIRNENNVVLQQKDNSAQWYKIANGLPVKISAKDTAVVNINTMQEQCYPYGLIRKSASYSQLFDLTNNSGKLPAILTYDNANLIWIEKNYGSYYINSNSKPQRVFPCIKKYPFVLNNTSSSSIFSIQEDETGTIWAGCYQGGISIIRNEQVISLPTLNFRITNGGTSNGKYIYLLSEGSQNGLLQINTNFSSKFITKGVNGFYTYISRDKTKFYYGTGEYNGIWISSLSGIEKGQPAWTKIDSSKGIKLKNILTITEDQSGRIWCGHPKRGIAIYDPGSGNARTWLVEKKETAFGAYSSLTDNKGTVWLGSGATGLWYYNDYTKEPSPANCRKIDHPLLNTGKPVMALSLYKNWLVISGYDKMMLLDLDSFYLKNKIRLRYLNPMEASFTSVTEQNTLLSSRIDSSIWFSTGDMLYQWDIKKWLGLPVYTVKTNTFLSAGGKTIPLSAESDNTFKPGFNSFDIHIRYLSPDNMPRYTRFTLVKDGDSILFTEPDLQNIYPVKNISSGDYRFILEVFEMDGRITRYIYPIHIQKFLWQQWWFWISLSVLLISLATYFINLKRKRQLAEQKVKTKEAELLTLKSEQERKIASLKLASLSSQFRPHFILNALNTIGAQMDDKPEAETVLSRLGESVNIIFNHAKQQHILHSFTNEWKLVKNVIDIHRLMYLKALNVSLPDEETIRFFQDIRVPMGILQIPVENALLHGLSNKETGPWSLSIHLLKTDHYIIVNINDNGIGRIKSASLSNFTKHGTGTKNLTEIINIINEANVGKITISYKDGVITTGEEVPGTTVIIEIPVNLNYDHE